MADLGPGQDLTSLGHAAEAMSRRPAPDDPPPGPPPMRPLDDLDLPPVGLVLAGGGAKGAYQIGAVRFLAEVGLTATAFAGTSIGALNMAVLAGQPDLTAGARALAQVWQNVMIETTSTSAPTGDGILDHTDLERVGGVLASLEHPAFRPGFLDALVREHVAGFCNPAWAAVFPALDPELTSRNWAWALDGLRSAAGVRCDWIALHERSLADARTAVMASAAIPLLFPPRRLDGMVYRDGGYADNTPAGALLAHTDADPIFVIHLTDGRLWDHRTLRGRQTLEIRPSRPLGPPGCGLATMLDFTPRRFAALAALGYQDAAVTVRRWLGPLLATHRLRSTVLRAVQAVALLETNTDANRASARCGFDPGNAG